MSEKPFLVHEALDGPKGKGWFCCYTSLHERNCSRRALHLIGDKTAPAARSRSEVAHTYKTDVVILTLETVDLFSV